MTEVQQTILKEVTDFYLGSHDFNGIPVRLLAPALSADLETLRQHISTLIESALVSVNCGDRHPNPHIKALEEEAPEVQIEKLTKPEFQHACIYPTTAHLKTVVEEHKYEGKPFTLRLALGYPQLSFLSFDLSVLESYRNDPRYSYYNDDISGSISVKNKFYESNEMRTSDQVLLKTFGFSYNENYDRAVAVFLRYLSDLSPEHQQIWNAKRLEGDYKLHPDYFRASIFGEWPEGVSIFEAFIEELHQINAMCELMGRPKLFKNDFRPKSRPAGFSFLTRPTLKEYNDFILLLDKAISDNIDRDFFQNEVAFEFDEPRPDGKVVVRQKGSIQILDDWVKKKFRPRDPQPVIEMIKTFKDIRAQRQRPAHAIDENVFDQKYFRRQREVIIRAYEAVNTLRAIFAGLPKVKGYKVPDWLQTGKIWTQ
jgi:hypothetical protein